MVSKNLRKHIPLFRQLVSMPPKVRKIIINECDKKLIAAFIELALNLCLDNIECEKSVAKKLKRHKKSLIALATTKKLSKTCKEQKKILNQQGGSFIPLF